MKTNLDGAGGLRGVDSLVWRWAGPRLLAGCARVVMLGLSLAGPLVWGQTVSQSYTLQPGWNAVYLEVDLVDKAPAQVFSGLPIDGVWARAESVTAAEFIQDPSEAAFQGSGWLAWFPPGRPDAFLSTLREVQANRAYLIKVRGTQPVSFALTGSVSYRRPAWVPGAYTLRGFPADPATPPTFGAYFQASPAHVDPALGVSSLEAYRLAGDRWVRVSAGEAIERGKAYWVHTRGSSDYEGPLSLSLDFGDGLAFGDTLSERTLHYRNLGLTPLEFAVEELGEDGVNALSWHEFDATGGNRWRPLTGLWTRTCAAGEQGRLRLAVRRQDVVGESYASVLRVRDGAGSVWWISVTAECTPAVGPASGDAGEGVPGRAGLWLGSAAVDSVSEAHSLAPGVPTPTRSVFSLRLLVHVDDNGQARLLKQVIQMWQDGTTRVSPEGDLEMAEPGRYVLLTDDRLIGRFRGAGVRDGTPVGRRLSSVGYDFGGEGVEAGGNTVLLSGEFGAGGQLMATLSTPVAHPTNPFLHRYHPDHNNLNARYDGPAEEAYAITRTIELAFAAEAPAAAKVTADYGYDRLMGEYRETIVGLHKEPLRVSGTFSLSRISHVAELNPSP